MTGMHSRYTLRLDKVLGSSGDETFALVGTREGQVCLAFAPEAISTDLRIPVLPVRSQGGWGLVKVPCRETQTPQLWVRAAQILREEETAEADPWTPSTAYPPGLPPGIGGAVARPGLSHGREARLY